MRRARGRNSKYPHFGPKSPQLVQATPPKFHVRTSFFPTGSQDFQKALHLIYLRKRRYG